jgi:hypothetical protein
MARSTGASTRETSKDMPRWSQREQTGMKSDTAPSRSTGQRDEIYGVVSVLYHALQGAETYAKYVTDAQNAGDSELEQFFESCRSEEQQRAERAKNLLADRLDDEARDEDDEGDEDDEEDTE